MSYNIDTVQIVRNKDAHFTVADFDKLVDELGEDTPGNCFIHRISDRRGRPITVDGDKVPITNLSWGSTGSGHLFDAFEKKVAPKVKGDIVAIVTWEGGDSIELWHIKDGEFTRINVIESLTLPGVVEALLGEMKTQI
jgi:hypothetical protein